MVGCPGYFVLQDRGMMIIVEVVPRKLPYAHQ
jgi:hypothetical protein